MLAPERAASRIFASAASTAAESRAANIILGIVALIAALICLRRPGDSLLAIVVVVGIFLVAAGVVSVVRAFVLPPPRGLALLVAGIEIGFGILLLALPDVSLGTLAILVGISMLVRGVYDIVIAFGIRRIRDTEAARPVAPGVTA